VRLTLRLYCSLLLALAACRAPGSTQEPAPKATVRPLAGLVAQQVIVVPVNSLRDVDALGWTAQIPRSREFMRAFDDSLAAELGARGLGTQWVYPAALVQSNRSNPSYSVDPYTLSAAPLRSTSMVPGSRLGNPLATQLRTLIALQESARAILIPVELYFDRAGPGAGVAVVRVALVDGRVGEIHWIGDVRSDPSPTFSRGLLSSLVAHTADLITAR
jgi:hypothetical protein